MSSNKYWIGHESFLHFCLNDLEQFYTYDFPNKVPGSTYAWHISFERAIEKGETEQIDNYIRNLRMWFGRYFPEIYEDADDIL